MKCPDCGFECLPDDVECLACGVDIASAVENKEKERVRGIEAAERKARYDIEFKKEMGLIPDDDDLKPVTKGTTLEETFKKKPTCPKCGAERLPEALDCIRCGIIFEKLKSGGNGVKKIQSKIQQNTDVQDNISTTKKTGSTISGTIRMPDEPSVVITNGGGSGFAVRPGELHDDDKTEEIDLAQLQMVDSDDERSGQELKTIPGADLHPGQKTDQAVIPPRDPSVNLSAVNDEARAKNVDNKAGEVRTPRYKIRNPQLLESPWIIRYRRYKSRFVHHRDAVIPGLKMFWNKLEVLCGGKKQLYKSVAALVIVLMFLASTPYIYKYYNHVKHDWQQRAEVERQKNIQLDFFKRKTEIVEHIRSIITEKKFQSAENEIAAFDIPALKSELTPVKNYLEEMKLVEEIGRIPESNYEKNFSAYSKLVELNNDNEMYMTKREEYRLKYADTEYLKAAAYFNHSKKDPKALDKAIETIKKSVELIPGSAKYQSMKHSLVSEKLMFFEGNDKIAMAVRDDGMGRGLFSGQRKLSIWLINKSPEIVYINVQYFTMYGKNGLKYTYNDIGNKFSSRLLPGEQTRGELYFRTSTGPSQITFNHLVCGAITRRFP